MLELNLSIPTFRMINWVIRENIDPAARAIQRINFSNIALPGRSILEIENVCIMTQVGIYNKIFKPDPSENPLASALWISLVLRLYLIVYSSSCHNSDTISVCVPD